MLFNREVLMKKNKRAQAQQLIIQLLGIVVVTMILIFGYRSVKTLGEQGEQVTFIQLKSQLRNSIETISADYGSKSIKKLNVPGKFKEICFGERMQDTDGAPGNVPAIYSQVIGDSLRDNTPKNVFLYPTGVESFWVGRLDVDNNFPSTAKIPGNDFPNFFCLPIKGGKVEVLLEGKGDRTVIRPPPVN